MFGHHAMFAQSQFLQAAVFTILLLGITVIEMLTPMVWKRGVLFGVTVAPDAIKQPEGRTLLTRWRIVMGSVGIGLAAANLVISLAIPSSTDLVIIGPVLLGAFLVADLCALLAFHQQALALALPAGNSFRAASLATNIPGRLAFWWEILPLALIAMTAGYLAVNYADAPATIAIHWNADGNPNAYLPKSIGAFFIPVWSQLGLWLLLTLLGIVSINRRIAGRLGSSVGFYGMITRLLFWIKTATVALFTAIAVFTVNAQHGQPIPYVSAVVIGFTVVLFLAIIISVQRFGQQMASDPSLVTGDGTPDRYWHGGIFYSNPHDPALLVPRRIGIGMTLNMAHPASWIILLLVAALIVFSIYVGVSAHQ